MSSDFVRPFSNIDGQIGQVEAGLVLIKACSKILPEIHDFVARSRNIRSGRLLHVQCHACGVSETAEQVHESRDVLLGVRNGTQIDWHYSLLMTLCLCPKLIPLGWGMSIGRWPDPASWSLV